MPTQQSPFEDLLTLARKARQYYFSPAQEARISTLIKLIFVAMIVACTIALSTGLPAHIGQNIDPKENMHDYLGLQEYVFVIMYFFGIQVTVCSLIVCLSIPLGLIPIPYRWTIGMRIKHLMLWLMTLWFGGLVVLALFWRLWWPDSLIVS
jgi:hypothetical protein